MLNTDTIVAIATAPGRGGIGIVRLSGRQARSIACRLSRRHTLTPRYAHYSEFHDPDGQLIDAGLVLFFPAPHSFTGEDVVELQGHGGPVLLDQLVDACIRLGARQARPGEFSERAFLHDKLDLAQAEAIADLINADTRAAAHAAMQSLQGTFSKEVDAMVDALIQLRMHVEAAIDFPEEEIDFLADRQVQSQLDALLAQLEIVLKEAERGRLIREGLTIVIAGRPNAGKSSLLNALVGHEAAIVTDIAGTTRDVLREDIQIDGLPLRIIDTAGLRLSPDIVEQEGIRRAWQAMEQADHLLILNDSSCYPVGPEPPGLEDLLPDEQQRLTAITLPTTLVHNKCDLSGLPAGPMSHPSMPCFALSATTGAGMETLRQHLKQLAGWQHQQPSRFSARRRHLAALEEARQHLLSGMHALQQYAAGELLAEDLRAAQRALEEITGTYTADDLLGEIFSSFCIGK